MEGIPFYKRPWFYIARWVVVLLVVYFWQAYRNGGLIFNEVAIFLDLACLFPILLLLWMGFFSQFVLPVHTFSDRWNIFTRLVGRLLGMSGPAIFVRNGEQLKRDGEDKRKGPGVLWLDSASAAVTRTAVKIKQVMGPGVHFIDSKEYIAGTLDLHIQVQSIGPKEEDKPFAEKSESQPDEEYHQVQDRRKLVSGLTRDGIEVVPNISVTFRVNTGFPEEGQPGSRFGYRTGYTPRAKKNEEEDKLAIKNAILGEGVNPNAVGSSRQRVAWNQLPAQLAVDVWREYVSKFTVDELFSPTQNFRTPPAPPPPLKEQEVDELSQPIQMGAKGGAMGNAAARILRQVNLLMAGMTARMEGKNGSKQPTASASFIPPPAEQRSQKPKTAFQVINEMIKARLTQPTVEFLDDFGKRVEGHDPIESREFNLLKQRGLTVMNAGVSNARFAPSIEDEIIGQWEANWLENANAEKEQIERRRTLIDTASQEQALRQYADQLSQALLREKPSGVKATLKTLLMRSRSVIIRNDELRRKMSVEQNELDAIIRWIEVNGP